MKLKDLQTLASDKSEDSASKTIIYFNNAGDNITVTKDNITKEQLAYNCNAINLLLNSKQVLEAVKTMQEQHDKQQAGSPSRKRKYEQEQASQGFFGSHSQSSKTDSRVAYNGSPTTAYPQHFSRDVIAYRNVSLPLLV